MKDFNKLKISLEGQLIGRRWNRALRAMGIARHFHCGKRKDGSPEFQHQVEIALFLMTLDLDNHEEFIVIAFLHDVMEDYGVTVDDISNGLTLDGITYAGFGRETASRVYNISKIYRGEKRDNDDVFSCMANCPYTSVVKGADRIHNHGTMTATFSIDKKIPSYLQETRNFILPMLKKARKAFPHQASVYYLIETILHRDIHMLECLLNRVEEKKIAGDNCPKCGKPWVDHEFGVPMPFCP